MTLLRCFWYAYTQSPNQAQQTLFIKILFVNISPVDDFPMRLNIFHSYQSCSPRGLLSTSYPSIRVDKVRADDDTLQFATSSNMQGLHFNNLKLWFHITNWKSERWVNANDFLFVRLFVCSSFPFQSFVYFFFFLCWFCCCYIYHRRTFYFDCGIRKWFFLSFFVFLFSVLLLFGLLRFTYECLTNEYQ